MHIVYVENVRIPSERAHAYQIAQTCAGLVRAGHTVTLLTPQRTTEDTFAFFALPANFFTHERLACVDPFAWKWPKVFLPVAYALQRWFFVRALRQRTKGMQADWWYTRDPAMVDALTPQVAGPWALELHDAPVALRRWARVMRHVTQYFGISEGIRNMLQGYGIPDARIAVAQDGFDPTLFASLPDRASVRRALGLPEDAFVLAYTGSCYPWKGVDAVVAAWEGTDPRAWLVIAGGAEADYARLRPRIAPSVAARVRLLPPMPRAELGAVFAAADVGLLSSSPDFAIGNLYTSPLKQFEYLAAGLPVLASDVPSAHDVLTEEVAMFYAHTPQDIAAAVNRVAQDLTWRMVASRRAPEVARPYTWDARAAHIAQVLLRAASPRSSV